MGTTHACTGVLAGVVVAAVFGAHPSDLFISAAVGAGAALLPDLDSPESTVGRSLGPVSGAVSWALSGLSAVVFRASGTDRDRRSGVDGRHRALTHVLPSCFVFGVVAGVLSLWPLGLGLVAGGLAALGISTIWREISEATAREARATATVLAVLLAGIAVWLPGGAPWLVGITVAVGALTHVLGDWLTYSGVPLTWPLVVGGQRWRRYRSPIPVATNPDSVAEAWVRRGSLIVAGGVAVLSEVPLPL
ncbi:metal-dependent hydrolase [Nocardiopsis sp. FR26]|uniref:metal-dependent hydrolase n=1 Tax=Nocardiopsis sp. FR26 TaxID=2605987 RepID=UPI001F16F646|nr:metal-dependent hydrolase [Nocardiopsis sp. FR26]